MTSGASIPADPENAMSESGELDETLAQLQPVDRVVGLGEPQRVGRFRFFLADQRWEWSDAVARMHGYEPGTVVPDADLLIRHHHPEDRQQLADGLERVLQGEPFSSRHRIIDTAGHTHWVVVVGDRMLDETGTVIGTSGFYVDVTESLQSDITTGISKAAESRAEIEQAKGVLMATYGITPERAFDILVWRSQETNIKVREFTRRFLNTMAGNMPPEARTQVDYTLLQTE
jgi:PAS domain S-box-containing protein